MLAMPNMAWNQCSAPLTYHILFISAGFCVSDKARERWGAEHTAGMWASEERAATQSMAQKTSRSKAEVCETPIPQFKSGCRLHKKFTRYFVYLVIFFRQYQICIVINVLHLWLTTSSLPAQDFASVTRRGSDEERTDRYASIRRASSLLLLLCCEYATIILRLDL